MGAESRYVGQSVKRVEDRKLLRGEGLFAADIRRPYMLHAAVLRSPFGHAEIAGLDVAAARALPSVVEVITARDLEAIGPIPMRLASHAEMLRGLQFPLAKERVRYCGEPVAVVVAECRYEAEDALGVIDVDYEPLEVVIDATTAEGSIAVHDEVPDNVVLRFAQECGDVDGALAAADHVIEATLRVQRHSAVPMETRGIVAEFQPSDGTMTIWGAGKVIHFNRSVLAALLDIPESRIRMIEGEVGGMFGVRGEFYPEDLLIPFLARRLKRPVSWIEDRAEHLQSANQSREQIHRVAVGCNDMGEVVAFHDDLLNDMGAYVRTHGATVPTMTAAYLPGPYRIDNYRCRVSCVLTNKTPTGTYRAPGRFEAAFVRERVMDMIARRLEIDPAEVRRRNFIPADEMPYDTGLGAHGTRVIYDSGDYAMEFERALERFGYEEARRWCEEQRAADRSVGVGIGYLVEKAGLGPWEYGRVEVDTSGEVVAYCGISDVGQGVETILTQVVADELSVPLERVRVVMGDTALVPFGNGSFASRGSVMAANAVRGAALKVKQRLLELASDSFESATVDLRLADGRVGVIGTDRSVGFAELAAAAQPGPALARKVKPGISEEDFFEVDTMVYPYGVHLAVVEVDPATGALDVLRYLVVYDVGRAINPMLVQGQIVGGFAQGLGGALLEEFRYDDGGQPLSANFMDYLLPTAMEVPEVDVLITEDAPSPLNPLGLKGAGEGGTTAVGATLANAVCDAFGGRIDINELPLSPEKLRTIASEIGGGA